MPSWTAGSARISRVLGGRRGAELLLVALLLVASAAELRGLGVSAGIDLRDRPGPVRHDVVGLALTAALPSALPARRRRPALVLAVVGALFVVGQLLDAPRLAADFAVLIALYSVGRHAAAPIAVRAAAGASLTLVAAAPFLPMSPSALVSALPVVVGIPLALGAVVRRRAVHRGPRPPTVPTGHPPAPDEAPHPEQRRLPGLTRREQEVLDLIGRGLTNAEIAAALFIGHETVKSHVRRILAKLGVRDRTQAALIAQRHRLSAPSREGEPSPPGPVPSAEG